MTKHQKISSTRWIALYFVPFVVSVIIGTALRVSLIVIYPVIALLLASYYRLRLSLAHVALGGLIAINLVLSCYPHFYIRYKLLSLFFMLPFLLLLFADVRPGRNIVGYTKIFIHSLTVVTLLNDVIGLIQVIRFPAYDDSFTGIYAQFSVSLNGLMLLNTVLFFYYFVNYLDQRKTKTLILSLALMISAILCYYGAGLVICMVAFVLTFFRGSIRSVIRTGFIALFSIGIVYYMMLAIKPQTLDYNIENAKRLLGMSAVEKPRKVLSFSNYIHSYPANLKDFLFGSGPGTFNSRSAFMIGSPSYFAKGRIIKALSQPYYFKNFAYPLWNDTNTSQALYQDGFRNQPFSSLLAFLGEYGIIFTASFAFFYYHMYHKMSTGQHASRSDPRFRFFKFLMILLSLLLIIDNYFEHPEIMLLLLLGIKLSQIDLISPNKPILQHVA